MPETIVMHDQNKVNSNNLFNYDNVECSNHLLHDLRKCTENINHIWSKQLDKLIIRTNVKRQYFIEQESESFSPVEEFSFFTNLDEAIMLGVRKLKGWPSL
ncbi:hypothetical protein [Pisciglobus halotolerans]|uniref:hypothetical protein n=1 Tax=Pisciglobus halotolerans TaxID=745365 RepID=UPI000B853412|nr:hypothetical protein [Pisciglobus halotolerans]